MTGSVRFKVRVTVTLMVSLVWLLSSTGLVALCIAIW